MTILDPPLAALESVKMLISLPTTDSLVRLVGAVVDAVAFGVQLVDAQPVLALIGEVGAGARGCRRKRSGNNHFLKCKNRPACFYS